MASLQQGFPNLTQKEVGGEVTFNDFVRMCDALVPAVVQAVNLAAPPAPVEGHVWTISTAAGWPDSPADGAPSDGDLAQWYNGAWYYITPVEGYTVYSIADAAQYRYLAGSWSIEVMSLGRSGGLSLSAASTTGANITPTPTKLVGFDSVLPGESGVTTSLPNSTIAINVKGIWSVSVLVTFDVVSDSSNQTREVALEIYNETDGAVFDVVASAAIPRYGEVVSMAVPLSFSVDDTNLNDEHSLRIYSPSGHTITVNSITALEFSVYRVNHQGFGP